MRSDRLLSIMLLLQTHGQMSSTELAKRLEVSVRTIARDVEALSAAGVPVYAVRGSSGGVALLPGYRTDVTGLTADESRSLFVLLSGSAHADLGLGQAVGSALRKVMAALPSPYRPDADLMSRRILIDPVRWKSSPDRQRPAVDLSVFQDALFADRRLRLRYRRGRDHGVSSYTVDPYGLVNKAGVWYLVADHRGRPRLFRLERALSAVALPEPVRRREGQELAQVWEQLRHRIDDLPADFAVTVLVRDPSLALLLRVHAADQPSVVDDESTPGWTKVELRFRSLFAAQPLLAFGGEVEVMAPQALRDLLLARAHEIVALYGA